MLYRAAAIVSFFINCGIARSDESALLPQFRRTRQFAEQERWQILESGVRIYINAPLPLKKRNHLLVVYARRQRLQPVELEATDHEGKKHLGTCYVTPDYLAIGDDRDFLRMPVTPQTAQSIASAASASLITKTLSDDVFRAAKIRLDPKPLTKDSWKWAGHRRSSLAATACLTSIPFIVPANHYRLRPSV